MTAPTININGDDYILTFEDNFDGPEFSAWRGHGSGGRWATSYSPHLHDHRYLPSNGVDHYYVDPDMTLFDNPFTQENGALTINPSPLNAAQQAAAEGQLYSTGLLTTEMSFHFQTGYVEVRADVPDEMGFWSSFWMLPSDGVWTSEIDLYEILGRDPGNVHTNLWDDQQPDEMPIGGFDPTNGYHTYGLLWTDTEITWTIDGQVVRTESNFIYEDMYILLSLALGGWAGDPDGTTDYGDGYSIDYVRVYELESNPNRNEAILPGSDVVNEVYGGTEFDDTLFGSRWDDNFSGLAGNDTMYGRAGNDLMFGRTGDDEMFGGEGNDKLLGAQGDDRLIGGAGSDRISGGRGTDHLWGGEFSADGATDTFGFEAGADTNFIHDFEAGLGGDILLLESFNETWASIQPAIQDLGWATEVNLAVIGADAGDVVYLVGVNANTLVEDNFLL